MSCEWSEVGSGLRSRQWQAEVFDEEGHAFLCEAAFHGEVLYCKSRLIPDFTNRGLWGHSAFFPSCPILGTTPSVDK